MNELLKNLGVIILLIGVITHYWCGSFGCTVFHRRYDK